MSRRLPDWLAEGVPSLVLSVGRSLTLVLAASAVLVAAAVWAGALSTVAGLWLHGAPVDAPARLYTVREPFQSWRAGAGMCTPAFHLWEARTRIVEDLAGFRWAAFQVGTPFAESIPGARVTPNFFRTLGARPQFGNLELPGGGQAVVVSHAFWRTRLGADPRVLGRALPIDGATYRVAGVLPESFWFASRRAQIWAPLDADPAGPHWAYLGVVARLKPGFTRRDLDAELQQVRHTHWVHGGFRIGRLETEIAGDLRNGLLTLLYGFAVVLACAIFEAARRPRLRTGLRYSGFLVLKSALALSGLAAGWILIMNPARQPAAGLSGAKVLFAYWLLALACCAAVYWCLLDHRYRCRVCLRRLRMPVPTGSWSSPLLDRPGTEFICPFGHGKLDVALVRLFGMEPARWTYYRDFWQELNEQKKGLGIGG